MATRPQGLANGGAADFRGNRLCVACWNGQHFGKEKTSEKKGRMVAHGAKTHTCHGGECECPCRIIWHEEQRAKEAAAEARKKDRP